MNSATGSLFYDYSVLVIADPEFRNGDCETYKERLTKYLKDRAGESALRVITVEGKYNFPSFQAMPSDDRNKTAFVKGVEDYLTQLNEIVVITKYPNDSFLEALNYRASEAGTTLSFYGY